MYTLFSFVARLITKVHDLRARMMQHIGPTIEMRQMQRSVDGAGWSEEKPVRLFASGITIQTASFTIKERHHHLAPRWDWRFPDSGRHLQQGASY